MECFGRLMAGLAPWLSLADDDTPEGINPTQTTPRMGKGQVRAGMTAVIKRMFGNNRNFNTKDFLTLGFNGSQAGISDYYTNNGSLYMASLALPAARSSRRRSLLDRCFTTLDFEESIGWRNFPRDHSYQEE